MASDDQLLRQRPKMDTTSKTSDDQHHQTTVPDGGWGWIVVLASFVLSVIYGGIVFTYGVLLPSLIVHFSATRAAIGGIGSLMIGLNCIVGPLVSVINNRFGCRATTILGSITMTSGFVISAFTSNVAALYFGFGVVAGVGGGILYLPEFVAINMYFQRRRGLATGLVVCGTGIGTITFAPLVAYLLHVYSWRGTLLIEAGVALNCCVCAMVFIPVSVRTRRRNASLTRASEKEAAVAHCQLENGDILRFSKDSVTVCQRPSIAGDSYSNYEVPISNQTRTENGIEKIEQQVADNVEEEDACEDSEKRKMDEEEKLKSCSVPQETGKLSSWAHYFDVSLFKDPLFLLFIISGFLASVCYSTPYAFLPDLAQVQAGIDEDRSALLISVIGISNTVIRVVFGFIADFACVNRLVLCCTVLIVGGLANMCVVYCDGFWLLVAYSTVFGACIGTYTCLVTVVTVDLFGAARLANAYGIYLFCMGVGFMVGTPFAGWLFDVTRSYNAAFLFTGMTMAGSGLVLVALVLLQRCKRRHYPAVDQTAIEPLDN